MKKQKPPAHLGTAAEIAKELKTNPRALETALWTVRCPVVTQGPDGPLYDRQKARFAFAIRGLKKSSSQTSTLNKTKK